MNEALESNTMTAHVEESRIDGRLYWSPQCMACDWHPTHAYYGDGAPWFGSRQSAQDDCDEHNAAEHPEGKAGRPEWATVARWADKQRATQSAAKR